MVCFSNFASTFNAMVYVAIRVSHSVASCKRWSGNVRALSGVELKSSQSVKMSKGRSFRDKYQEKVTKEARPLFPQSGKLGIVSLY